MEKLTKKLTAETEPVLNWLDVTSYVDDAVGSGAWIDKITLETYANGELKSAEIEMSVRDEEEVERIKILD